MSLRHFASVRAKEAAAKLLCTLASTSQNISRIATAGAIPHLIQPPWRFTLAVVQEAAAKAWGSRTPVPRHTSYCFCISSIHVSAGLCLSLFASKQCQETLCEGALPHARHRPPLPSVSLSLNGGVLLEWGYILWCWWCQRLIGAMRTCLLPEHDTCAGFRLDCI